MEPQFNLGVELNGFEFAAAIPLAPLVEAFDVFSSRVAELRAQDEDPSLLPYRCVRLKCPSCSASVMHLTVVHRSDGLRRACRSCRVEFPADV